MLHEKESHAVVLPPSRPTAVTSKVFRLVVGTAILTIVMFWKGPSFISVLVFLPIIVFLFLTRLDIALCIVIVLYMMLVAVPLPIHHHLPPESQPTFPSIRDFYRFWV